MSDLPDPGANPGTINGNQLQSTSAASVVTGVHKEQEPLGSNEQVQFQERPTDVEISPELARAGVIKRSETIDLPPDVRQMGVQAIGPAQGVTGTATIQLPLTDEQIVVGLHAQIISSIRWLAEWCVRRLKQVHVHLKTLGRKVVRERE